MEGFSKQESSYSMKKKINEQIKNLEWPSNDEYFQLLKNALDDYHKMVNDGVLIPRGNRIATVIINNDNNSW